MRLPDAHYLILSSRLIPGLDGGYTVATMARAAQMAAAGARSVRLLTFDPGTVADHAQHRAEFARQGRLARDHGTLRNLFDEASADRSWLLGVAEPGERDATLNYREVSDAEGQPLIALPNVPDPSGWHLSAAPVVVYDELGAERGVVAGFPALYLAWLEHVVARLRAEETLPVVVICESRQLGEILAGWSDRGVRIIHTIHTMHVERPFTPDAPLNGLWQRWFGVADRFDAVAWPTRAQRDDVVARFGGDNHLVVPSGVELPDRSAPVGQATLGDSMAPGSGTSDEARPDQSAQSDGKGSAEVGGSRGQVVMMNRLAPGKRIDHTIRAFLAADVPGSRLDIYGDGGEREGLQTLIDELGAGERVALRGATTTPGRVLDGAELFVTSTAYEGQGLAIVEALAHGCPVVSYDIRYGPADAMADGGGILVPDGDEAALADAIRRVLTDDALRTRLAAEATASAQRWSVGAAMAALADAARFALAGELRR